MTCGHAVTPQSLTAWCRSLLDQVIHLFKLKNQFLLTGTYSKLKVCHILRVSTSSYALHLEKAHCKDAMQNGPMWKCGGWLYWHKRSSAILKRRWLSLLQLSTANTKQWVTGINHNIYPRTIVFLNRFIKVGTELFFNFIISVLDVRHSSRGPTLPISVSCAQSARLRRVGYFISAGSVWESGKAQALDLTAVTIPTAPIQILKSWQNVVI